MGNFYYSKQRLQIIKLLNAFTWAAVALWLNMTRDVLLDSQIRSSAVNICGFEAIITEHW